MQARIILSILLMTYSLAACKLWQADDAVLSWLESYSEVGATLVVYRLPVTGSPPPAPDHRVSRPNDSLHTATYHDTVLTLYHCARARWLATSGDSCQCMTGRNDFLSTLSRVSAAVVRFYCKCH